MPFMQHFVKLRARVNQSEMSKYHNFSPLQNSPGETTWRLWATSSSTSSAGPCPGKDSGRRQRLGNTRRSARRSFRPPWRSFVKEHQVGNTFLPADDTRGGGGGENSAFQTKQSEKWFIYWEALSQEIWITPLSRPRWSPASRKKKFVPASFSFLCCSGLES